MTFSVKIEGGKELREKLKSLGPEIKAGVDIVNNATGLELRTEIVKGYHEGNKVGIVYQKYNPRRTHQASEEGQAPASDTGRLANSVVYFAEHGGVAVKAFADYGSWLEFGTFNIAPRPLWVPEANKMKPKYIGRLEKMIARAVE